MVQNNNSRIILQLFSSILLLVSNIKCETESTDSDANIEIKADDYKRLLTSAEFLRNYKPFYNYIYAKNRESKSNNGPYFTEPENGNEGYETMPSSIQITAVPGGLGGPLYPGQLPGFTGTDPINPFPGALNTFQKFPVFVINKSKSDHYKWLIPLLLLLGAPLLIGIILIPIALQSVFFLMTIIRNLGILLPLLPAITGALGNGMNPIIPATG